jgi:hypothetical protein
MPEEDENTCNVEIIFKKPAQLPEHVPDPTPEVAPAPPPPAPLSPIMETSRENWKSSSSRCG